MFELSRRCKQLHVEMITSLARKKHKRALSIGLILMIVVICGQVVSLATAGASNSDDYDEERSDSGTAVDNEQFVVGRGAREPTTATTTTTTGPVDAQDLLLVLAVRELCSRNPTECDQPDQSDISRFSLEGDTRQHNRKRRHELIARSAHATNQISGVLIGDLPVGRNLTNDPRMRAGDDLDRVGSWSGSPNDRARFAPLGAVNPVAPGANGERRHRISTRAWRQPGPRAGPNTYRVSLEEARRFIRAQQEEGLASYAMGTMAPSLLYARPRATGSDSAEQQQQQQQVAARVYEEPTRDQLNTRPAAAAPTRGGSSGPITRSRAPVSIREQRSSEPTPVLPKRTELSPENPFTTTAKGTSASGHQLVREETSTGTSSSGGGGDKTQDVMQCNLRSYTYRATKADGRGNTCTGLITASICYGGCDSGEIADWLFPYKKSIHKVCRHGTRLRRRVLLSECHSANSKTEPIEDSLREYHYVDARDCICKKCTGTDTNCLGTMTQPHLQTLGETVAELSAANGD